MRVRIKASIRDRSKVKFGIYYRERVRDRAGLEVRIE